MLLEDQAATVLSQVGRQQKLTGLSKVADTVLDLPVVKQLVTQP